MKKLLHLMLVFAAICCAILISVSTCRRQQGDRVPYYDTIPIYDTIRYDTLIPRDSVILKYISIKLPIVDTSYHFRDTTKMIPETSMQPICIDSSKADSATVLIPITQKRYKEKNFEAWVSGYRPALDSLHIFNENYLLRPNKQKPKRWGIGAQVGYDLRTGAYAGFGISYNFIVF